MSAALFTAWLGAACARAGDCDEAARHIELARQDAVTARHYARIRDADMHGRGGPPGGTRKWSHPSDLNRRPTVYETVALPAELGWQAPMPSAARRSPAGPEGARGSGDVAKGDEAVNVADGSCSTSAMVRMGDAMTGMPSLAAEAHRALIDVASPPAHHRVMESFIDLRSDTVTRPTRAMRQVMADAPVGDDVYGEDPTVRALEERVAELLGKESALFVPSGTQANQIALMLHCQSGDAVFAPDDAHFGLYESGAAAALVGVQIHALGSALPDASAFEARLFPDMFYQPRPRLLALENTHNHAGGRVYPQERAEAIAQRARAEGLGVHLDGARLWNAHVATDEPLSRLAAVGDTVSVCFSKGLGAPMGSALAMPESWRARALRFRRRMGGALRQAGIVAAGALYALEHHLANLADDHRRAQHLARALMPLGADPRRTDTNMVVFTHSDAPAFVESAAKVGVRIGAMGRRTVRLVTHRDLRDEDIDLALERLLQLPHAAP